MNFIPNTDAERAEMFKTIGVGSFEEMISNIPPSLRLKGGLKLPPALSEYEVVGHLRELSKKNANTIDNLCFMGGGAYDHFIPAIVDHVISRPEFYTAYTPYQAELSQGTLQVMYEFQTCVSLLAGLDIANASMYDGGSAIPEAINLAAGANKKSRVLISSALHPHYVEVINTYLSGTGLKIEEIEIKNGITHVEALKNAIGEDCACVVIQHPNFFGNLEEVDEINAVIKQYPQIHFIVSFNPITTGLLKSPGEYGADTAVAEGQPLGLPLNFGGPYIGLFATKQENIRRMPGRMAGKTVDKNGKEGFILALQTREQHIKREKATSNICTNEGLMAVAVLTYLSWIGREGLVEVSRLCYNHAHYLAEGISKIPGFRLKYPAEFFHEFVYESDKNHDEIINKLKENNILGGINLKKFGQTGILVAVTEKRSKQELDKYLDILKSI